MDFNKSVQTGPVQRSMGLIIVFLTCGLSLFHPGQGGIGPVAAGSWFFDLIALTRPQSPTVANNPFFRNYVQPAKPVDRFLTANHAQSLQSGRKSVRETSDSKVSQYRATPNPFLSQTNLPSSQTFSHPSSNLAYVEPSGAHELDTKRPVTDRSNMQAQEAAICHALTGLTTHQRKICLQHSGLVWAMLEGTQLGLHECVHQFQHEQWNCSAVNVLYRTQPDSIQMSSVSGLEGILQRAVNVLYRTQPDSIQMSSVSGLEGILQRGSRETAFLSSAWSAGVVQAITRACSRGQMGTCDCDPHRRDGQDRDADGVFTWGGCSDPIKFGMRLTRLFLDANDREHRDSAIRREEELHGPRFGSTSVARGSAQQPGRRGMPDRYVRYTRSSVLESISNNSSQRAVRGSGHLEAGINETVNMRTPRHMLTPQELQAETLRIIQTKARSRETAFLSSAWSAGVVQAITRACSRGQMGTCDCDPHRRDGQDRDADGVFTWGGCSDPIKFGMRLTRLFLDANDREHRDSAIRREEELHGPRFGSTSVARGSAQQPGRRAGINETVNMRTPRHMLTPQELQAETLRIIQTKARVLMNFHNRRAGRKMVWKNRVRKCKCHGVSGACSMRTCWQRVNEFRRVGILLKAAYDEAVRVTYEPRRDTLRPLSVDRFESPIHSSYPIGRVLNRLSINRQDRLHSGAGQPTWLAANEGRPGITDHQSVRQTDKNLWRKRRWPRSALETAQLSKSKMIYLEESPNYCRFDPTIGVVRFVAKYVGNGPWSTAANIDSTVTYAGIQQHSVAKYPQIYMLLPVQDNRNLLSCFHTFVFTRISTLSSYVLTF
ncbi:hypothetical protein AHF37_01419 [Paragonimus kellicotti]|nr:hypothetical protein AHF37_01419 [Paragonimus kellicotti]